MPGRQVTPATPAHVGGQAVRVHDAALLRASAAAWSLEHRLPIVISCLLACVVGGMGLAAYREVRATTVSRAADRLERVNRELIAAGARSTAIRTAAMHAIAADRVTAAALAGHADSATITARIAELRDPADSVSLGWRIATADGTPRYATSSGWTARDSAVLATTVAEALRTGTDRRSPLFATDERMHAWLVVPVRSGGRIVGTVAELSRIADNANADATIRGLIEDDARMLFTSVGSAEWSTTRGRPTVAPFDPPASENHATRVPTPNGPAYAVQATIPTTPWRVVLYQSEASVLRRPLEFLRRLLAAGALVLALATAGAWLLSRHVTRPLRDMTDAASALAHGDYGRRVVVSGGGREVASLAATFNAMASAIGDAHATLADRNAELQDANAAKSQFLAMMSHELRTPLNAIGGFTELLQLGLRGPVTAEQVEDLGRIRRNKDLLLSIITDILEFARTDAGALVLRVERVAVAPLLADVADLVGQQLAARQIRFAVGDVPDLAIVRADRERTLQILLNLLSNAAKFTPAGGEVAVTTVVAADTVRIDVRDSGAGIDAEHLEEIFEPFFQLDASLTRRAGGTGLGLAIARQLCSAMGGTLSVRSTVGEGSTFSLSLPRAEPADGAVAPSLGAGQSIGQVA